MIRILLSTFSIVAIVSTASQAALIVYEGFDYPVGATLSGQNGGTGFTAPWFEELFGAPNSDLDVIQSGSLTFGGLQTSGQSVKSQAPIRRESSYNRNITAIPGTTGTTLWLSFLTRKDTATGAGESAFGLAINGRVFVGDPAIGNTYILGDFGDGEVGVSTVPVVAFQTVFLVVRIDFLAGNDTIRLFINPVPGGSAPTTAAATKTDRDLAAIDQIGIFARDASGDPRRSFDEIRIGTAYADVAPVPEPSSAALLGLGMLLLARRSRA